MARPKGPERKRVQVTLSSEAWDLLTRIADALEQPKAAILAELVEELLPSMGNTIDAIKLAKEGQAREAQRLVTNFGAEAVMTLQQAQLEFDRLLTADEAKKRKGKGRGRRSGTS